MPASYFRHNSDSHVFKDIVVPGALYLLVAQLTLLLAIYDGQILPVWPAAGVAVAMVLLRGYVASVGVFFGAFLNALINWLSVNQDGDIAVGALVSIGLAVGPALEALLVSALCWRYLNSQLRFANELYMLRLAFLGVPLVCLVADSFSAFVQWLSQSEMANFGFTDWITLWVADVVGIITVAPVILMFLQRAIDGEARRRFSVALPMSLLLLLVFVLFHFSQLRDLREMHKSFDSSSRMFHQQLLSSIDQGVQRLQGLKIYFENSDKVTAEEFESFSHSILENNGYIHRLGWIPKITSDQREAYEADPDTPTIIREHRMAELGVAAKDRPVYFPLTYLAPNPYGEDLLGFDTAMERPASLAQSIAEKSGTAATTTQIPVLNDESLVTFLSVVKDQQLIGFVSGVTRTHDFIEGIFASEEGRNTDLYLRVWDITETPEIVFSTEDFTEDSHILLQRQFYRGGRHWRVEYVPTQVFLAEFSNWNTLFILFGGMLFTLLAGGWLISLSERNQHISREVRNRTLELEREVLAREEVQEELEKLSLAVEHSPTMVLITDTQGVIEYVNPKFSDVSGYTPEELRGENANLLFASTNRPTFFSSLIAQLARHGEWQGEVETAKKNGEKYWAQIMLAGIYKEGSLKHVVSVHQDITEYILAHEKISYQARHDLLTGLLNRYEFERQLKAVVAEAKKSDDIHTVCFCDLDQFKVINDTSGHIAGDELLKQVAEILQSCLRKSDILGRLGGDEFGIILRNSSLEESEKVTAKILSELEEFRFAWEGLVYSIGASLGVVAVDSHCADHTEILKNADSACYAAKDAGRNRAHVYQLDDELLAKREGEISWVSEINAALAENRFELHGQIIVPVLDPTLKPSIEILVRLRRDGKMVMPGAFLPAAERYGVACKIDIWVVKSLFDWVEKNPELAAQFDSMAINLAGASLGDQRLLNFIYDALETRSIDFSLIKFEITETSAIANLSDTRNFINTVREYGCGFSLDDFGSGLSSFAYLKNLPVDTLKIDGMFVKDIVDDPIDRAMVKSINEIGRVMKKRTIAEFVENEQVLAILREIGVDYAQGYGLGRPTPLHELALDYAPAPIREAYLRSLG